MQLAETLPLIIGSAARRYVDGVRHSPPRTWFPVAPFWLLLIAAILARFAGSPFRVVRAACAAARDRRANGASGGEAANVVAASESWNLVRS